MFENLHLLTQVDFPLEGYDALLGATLVADFFGTVAHLHVFLAYRPQTKQLIVSISGTATLPQALQDLKAMKHTLSSGRGAVHAGFWGVYKGIKSQTLEGIQKGLRDHAVDELVITGHSMGGAVSIFLTLDLLAGEIPLPQGLNIKLVAYGTPRPGDQKLSKSWQAQVQAYRNKNGESSFKEFSIKAYNDGLFFTYLRVRFY